MVGVINQGRPGRTVHTEAGEPSSVIKARAVVETRVRGTLVDVGLTPVSRVARCAVTPERARCVDARAAVFTRRTPTCRQLLQLSAVAN